MGRGDLPALHDRYIHAGKVVDIHHNYAAPYCVHCLLGLVDEQVVCGVGSAYELEFGVRGAEG